MGIIKDIKSDAKNSFTKIQSSDAQRLERILNNLFYLPKDQENEARFVKQVMTRGGESQERAGLHASAMLAGDAEYCVRKQVLSLFYKQAQGEQLPVNVLRIFEEGNAVHEKWQRMFIRGGYSSPDELDVTQYCEKYQLSYSPDIICEIPEFYDGKMVGELKSVNTYQFQKMVRHPSAWKQCLFYMHMTGIKKGFVLCEDKNTQEIKLEVYDYDPSQVSKFIDRCEEVQYHKEKLLNEKKMVKRPDWAKTPGCKKCAECPMRDACWNIGNGRVRLEHGESQIDR